jgi:hypothetical protein
MLVFAIVEKYKNLMVSSNMISTPNFMQFRLLVQNLLGGQTGGNMLKLRA